MIDDDDMDFEFEPDGEWDSMDYIDDMGTNSRQMMMDVVYSSIVNNKLAVLNSVSVTSMKLKAIEHVLNFFEELEDYEKCAELKKIIDKIKE
jgi:hypothetical protein